MAFLSKLTIAAVALLSLATSTRSEVMVEVSFDIALKEQTENGFKPTDALTLYLQSPKMKWLRSFHMLLSGQVTKPHRVAFMAFKDMGAWAEFEEEHLDKTNVLYDHFWLNSRRVMWNEVNEAHEYPTRTRSVDRPGGFIWQLKFSVIQGKEAAFNQFWDETVRKAMPELKENEGFVESKRYSGLNLQRTFQHQIQWEFLGMPELSRGVMESPVMLAFFDELGKYCSDWNSAVLAPPTDDKGKQIGYFYTAAGADKEKEDL